MSIEFSYSDGNGNTYIIRSEKYKTLEYIPVKPQYSSSGIYDGGDPALKKIKDTHYEQIISVLNEAINNKECHIENRIKTSGIITKKKNKLQEVIIISPKSKEFKTIETLLKEILEN